MKKFLLGIATVFALTSAAPAFVAVAAPPKKQESKKGGDKKGGDKKDADKKDADKKDADKEPDSKGLCCKAGDCEETSLPPCS